MLGTHVKLERDKAGRWAFKLEKKPTDVALLKSLMKNLLGFITKQGCSDVQHHAGVFNVAHRASFLLAGSVR